MWCFYTDMRSAMVQAALERNRHEQHDEMPMAFRRNTGAKLPVYSISPSPSFDASSQDSTGSFSSSSNTHQLAPVSACMVSVD